jgi:hypothetical protein
MRSSEFLNEADPANPYTGKDPVKAAAWAKLSPQVQKKLGGADPTDPYIIARMTKGELGGLFGGGATDANPDGTPKATAVPAAAAPAAAPNVEQNAATVSQLADKPPVAAPAATPVADAVAASGEPDNVTGVDSAVAANAAQTATPPAKAKPTSDPKVLALQQQLIAAGAKIKADGVMGPATRAAQKQFGSNQSSAETARLARQNVAPTATAVSPRPSIGLASQLEWDRQYAKTHNSNGTPMGAQAATPTPAAPLKPGLGNSPMRESNFEESVNRMRRLSTLLKG